MIALHEDGHKGDELLTRYLALEKEAQSLIPQIQKAIDVKNQERSGFMKISASLPQGGAVLDNMLAIAYGMMESYPGD